MNYEDQVLAHLKKDEVRNINMINFLESYPVYFMEMIGDSVLVKGVSDRKWVYISSKSVAELELIKWKLDNSDRCYAIIEDWMMPILTDGSKVKWKLSTMKLVLSGQEIIPGTTQDISELTTEDAGFIYENSDYKDYVSIEYISERIANGISSCIRIEGKPIAWAITQDDGAIGFLHVLPEYRKRGFGRDVTVDMINKVREKGKIPFVHIEEDNLKSMGLALGLGFKKDRIVNWFEIE